MAYQGRRGTLVRGKLLGRPETVIGIYTGHDEVLCEHLGDIEPQLCEDIHPDGTREGAAVWRKLNPLYLAYRKVGVCR